MTARVLGDIPASANITAEDVGLLTGPTLTGVTYANSWADFGSGFVGLQYGKQGGFVILRGMCVAPNPITNLLITTLPVGFRPRGKFRAPIAVGTGAGTVDIGSDGTVTAVTSSAGTVYSFDLVFEVA